MTESTKGDQPTVYDFAISYAAEGYGAFIDAMKNTIESFVANWNSEAIAEVDEKIKILSYSKEVVGNAPPRLGDRRY